MTSNRLVNYDQSPGSPDGASLCGPRTPPMEEDTPTVQSPFSPEIQQTVPRPEGSVVRAKIEMDDPDGSLCIPLEMIASKGLTHEAKVEMEALRVRTGNDPDEAEFELLVLPGQLKIAADLRHLRRNVVFAHSLSMAEFTHPNVLEIMAHCQDFKVAFNRQQEMTSERSFWKGCMTFRMPTVSDAEEAFLLLKDVRSDLNVRILKDSENAFDVMERWNSHKLNSDNNTKETERLLIASNLAPGSTEAKLKHLFSDALEVVLAQRKICDRSFAYLIYESTSKMEEAYKKYTTKNITYDGHILRILKYESPKNIPEDFLRLKERFQILKLLERFVAALTLVDGLSEQLQNKTRKAASFLSDLVNSDERARRVLHLPVFTFEELHLVLDISRSPAVVDLPPFTELFAAFNVELDQLKESKNDRRYYLCSDSSEIDKKVERPDVDSKRKHSSALASNSDELPTRQTEDRVHKTQRHIPQQMPSHQSRTFSVVRRFPSSSANLRRSTYSRDFSYARGYGRLRYEPFATSSCTTQRQTRQFWTRR